MAATATTSRQSHGSRAGSYNVTGLLAVLFIYRLINALSMKTFFQPDEYFQSLEPAWQDAFGAKSGAWITWEWHERLRSSIHPLLFAKVYEVALGIANALNASPSLRSEMLLAAPKVMQAAFATCTDFFTYDLASKVYGSRSQTPRAALALTVLSPWQWFCSVRTLSNSLETTLTIIALTFWPWDWLIQPKESTKKQNGAIAGKSVQRKDPPVSSPAPKGFYISLVAAAIACILRPTNILVWATLSTSLLWSAMSFARTITLARGAVIAGSTVLAVSAAVDRTFYGEWVFPPLRFVYFNVVQSLAVFYGRNRHDYYFSEGLYLLLTTATPFAAVGMWQALTIRSEHMSGSVKKLQIRRMLALSIVTSLVALSLIAHKEVRFIYPLLPMLHVLAAKPFATFFDPFPIPRMKYRLIILILGIAVNSFIAYYTGYVHQRGVIDVMHYLRHEQEARFQLAAPAEKNLTVGFLMPCHSTPWRSHLVYPEIDAWALTCEPPLAIPMAERESYLDEADIFYASPVRWLFQNMRGEWVVQNGLLDEAEQKSHELRRAWPEYLVFFQQLEPTMEKVLVSGKYYECWRGFNTHWHDDWRREGHVIVWCMREP